MGIAGVSPGSLLLIFMILLLLFGKSRIKDLAEELGSAVKSFKRAVDESDTAPTKDAKSVDDTQI
ncbi:MAG: twin-arginine translocase TatA/TatE family subunit [Pseudomonadota bacterium]|nr:twin-arginine translocase TatA/TatE family subunit [Pseudomonadota bacterium]